MISSLYLRLSAISLSVLWLITAGFYLWLDDSDWGLFGLIMLLASALVLALVKYGFSGIQARLTALEAGLLNFKDNEFSTTLSIQGNDELSRLCRLYNQAAEKLRDEKQSIYQRELLLDRVIESSPILMFLVDDDDYFVYSNHMTRHFLNRGHRLEGEKFSQLIESWPESLSQAIKRHQDGLFTIEQEGSSDTWHLSRGDFLLNNKKHQLFLLKQMTRELNRQEVAVWKKVIRVISHELNNSLAPISSVTHSGQLLADKHRDEKLERVFSTIKERVEHLNRFILGYAKFAKLPSPRCEQVSWQDFIAKLQSQMTFSVDGELPDQPGYFDPSQLEQVLINLLKNAAEAGSEADKIELSVEYTNPTFRLRVKDRGTGMSEQVLKNALLPFYSNKQSGTGLGLALCREIIEAHDGTLALHNRKGGGLEVVITLFCGDAVQNEFATE